MRSSSSRITAIDLGQLVGRRLPGQDLQVAAADRDRRAQLVRALADERALALERGLEAVEHAVERRRELSDRVGAAGVGDPAREVAAARDLVRGVAPICAIRSRSCSASAASSRYAR